MCVIVYSDSPCDTDLSITPTNPYNPLNVETPKVNYSFQPISPVVVSHHPQLSPISGSFDIDGHSSTDSPLTISSCRYWNKSPTNECPLNELQFESDLGSDRSRPQSSTNELPLTELNLALFTSNCQNSVSNYAKMSTNELPLSDLNLLQQNSNKNKISCDNDSLEVNFESETDSETSKYNDKKLNDIQNRRDSWPQHRSFSDPNILKTEKLFHLENAKESLSPVHVPCFPLSFYPTSDADVTQDEHFNDDSHRNLLYSNFYARSPTNLLSFFSSSPKRPTRSLSHPYPSVTKPSMSDTESGSSGTRRHRHSIAGQMSYFKMLGYGFGFGGPLGFKKITGGSTNSLFSTAVISGSSSAPNLRDMIPSTASASGDAKY